MKKKDLYITKLISKFEKAFQRYEAHKRMQLEMIHWAVEQLQNMGMSEYDKLRLEFFFYAPTKEKAEKLNRILKEKYHYEIAPIHKTGNRFSVCGLTDCIIISSGIIQEWVSEMCDIAFENDCEFDGWGTIADQ